MPRRRHIYVSHFVLVLLTLAFAGCPNSCANLARNRYIDTAMQNYEWEYEFEEIRDAVHHTALDWTNMDLNSEELVVGEMWILHPEDEYGWQAVTIEERGGHYKVVAMSGSGSPDEDEGTFDGQLALEILERIDDQASAEIRAEAGRRGDKARGCAQRTTACLVDVATD